MPVVLVDVYERLLLSFDLGLYDCLNTLNESHKIRKAADGFEKPTRPFLLCAVIHSLLADKRTKTVSKLFRLKHAVEVMKASY